MIFLEIFWLPSILECNQQIPVCKYYNLLHFILLYIFTKKKKTNTITQNGMATNTTILNYGFFKYFIIVVLRIVNSVVQAVAGHQTKTGNYKLQN